MHRDIVFIVKKQDQDGNWYAESQEKINLSASILQQKQVKHILTR